MVSSIYTADHVYVKFIFYSENTPPLKTTRDMVESSFTPAGFQAATAQGGVGGLI